MIFLGGGVIRLNRFKRLFKSLVFLGLGRRLKIGLEGCKLFKSLGIV